ncbi:platelet-activating factor acetylhydrolase IB subunit gamma-like, partial [Diaphorina citri]|uniref:Platelet-activating factor acetylhydrolase IB subunit gamma-like n=1 Tax=Diaphorina citri TaxID=121845 RepID=A0A1S3DRR1_DIACI
LLFSSSQELLPRGKLINKLWLKNLATNQILADKLSPAPLGPKVHLIQHNTDEIISKDEISQGDFYDYLHLTESGYRKVFTPVYEKVKQILSDLDK